MSGDLEGTQSERIPVLFRADLLPVDLSRLEAFRDSLGPAALAHIIVNPDELPRTPEGLRLDLLEELPEGHFISRTGLSRFAVRNIPSRDSSAARNRAYTIFDAVVEHSKLGHLDPADVNQRCPCPLHCVKVITPPTWKDTSKVTYFIDPLGLILALEGDPEHDPPIEPVLCKLPINPISGEFAKPGQNTLFSSPSFQLIIDFVAALRAT